MVAVGDDELFVAHVFENFADKSGVGQFPDAVDDVVLVGDLEVGGTGFAVGCVEEEVFGGEGWVGVEHVDLLWVGADGFEESEAIRFVLGEGLFVAVDEVIGVVIEVAEGDEAAAFADFGRFSGRGASGDGVGLGIAVEGGFGFFAEDAFVAPGVIRRGGAGIDVFRVGVGGFTFAEDDADEVVGALGVVGGLHFGADFVVGLRDDIGHVDAGGVVAESAKGIQAGHGFDCSFRRRDRVARAEAEASGWWCGE